MKKEMIKAYTVFLVTIMTEEMWLSESGNIERNCLKARDMLVENSIYPHETDQLPIACQMNSITPHINGCCDQALFKSIMLTGTSEFTRRWNMFWHNISQSLTGDAQFLQNYLVTSLRLTMNGLHDLFASSYGYNYDHNKDFVEKFFFELESYMLGNKQNIGSLVDDFFDGLLTRVLRVMLLVKSDHDRSVVDCIASKLKPLKPFDQAPDFIRVMSIRAFPPARILRNGLLLGSTIVKSFSGKMILNHSCVGEWTKLRYCHLCSGIFQPVICRNYCLNRLSTCLLPEASLDKYWLLFIDQLVRVAELLKDSKSFPLIIRPLQIHISDAIMNLQTSFFRLEQSEERFNDCLTEKSKEYPSLLFKTVVKQVKYRQRRRRRFVSVDRFSPFKRHKQPYLYNNHNGLKLWADNIRKKYAQIREPFLDVIKHFCTDELLRDSFEKNRNDGSDVCWTGEKLTNRSHMTDKSTINESIIYTDFETDHAIRSLQRMTEMIHSVIENNEDPDYMLIEEINSTNESDNLDNQLSGYPMVNSLMSNKESKHMLTKLSDSELLYPRRISLKNNSSTDNAFLPYMQSNRSSNRFTLHSTLLHENHPSQDVNIDGYDNSGTSPELINYQSRVPWFSDDEDVSTLNEHSLMTTSNHLRSKVSLDIQTKVFTSSSTDQNIISSDLTKVSSQFDENRFSTSYLLSKQWIETDTVPYINPPQSLWFPSAKHRKIIWIHDTNCGIILTWNVFTLNYCIYLICVYFKWLTGIYC